MIHAVATSPQSHWKGFLGRKPKQKQKQWPSRGTRPPTGWREDVLYEDS